MRTWVAGSGFQKTALMDSMLESMMFLGLEAVHRTDGFNLQAMMS